MSLLHQLHQDLNQSNNYQQWLEIATEIDLKTGMEAWRDCEQSDDYPYQLLEEHIIKLQALLNDKNYHELAFFIKESLHRTLGELGGIQLKGSF